MKLITTNKKKLPKIHLSKRKIVVSVLILIFIGLGLYLYMNMKNKSTLTNSIYISAPVEKRNVISRLNGAAPLEPVDSYTITTLVNGTVIASDIKEGDTVTKGQLLYGLSEKTSTTGITSAENSLEQAQTNYKRVLEGQSRLSVKSGVSGVVANISVKKGEQVSAGQEIARIENRDVVKLIVPFPSDDALSFVIGQSVTVTLDGSFEKLNGAITNISTLDEVLPGNRITRKVTISINNPGGISTGQAASASVGETGSSGNAKLVYGETVIITSDISGKVEEINTPIGTRVSEGTQLIRLSSVSLSDEIKNSLNSIKVAEQTLKDQKTQAELEKETRTILSPIAGTVVERAVKAGDNVTSGKTLCTIYDLSALIFKMNIDEMDVSKVYVGQTVKITANAIEEKEYKGTVTRVGINGTSASGITTYPVTVTVKDTEGLLPGMNVKAEIELEKAEGVLTIPRAAVLRGNLVLITKDSPSAKNVTLDAAPEGYVYVSVVCGLSDSEYVQLISGLAEGDVVAYEPPVSDNLNLETEMEMGGLF